MKQQKKKVTIQILLLFFCAMSGYALGRAIVPSGFFSVMLSGLFAMLGAWIGIEVAEVIEQKERKKLEREEVEEYKRSERLKDKNKQEVSDVLCPHCGKFMVTKTGRNGKFLACPET